MLKTGGAGAPTCTEGERRSACVQREGKRSQKDVCTLTFIATLVMESKI